MPSDNQRVLDTIPHGKRESVLVKFSIIGTSPLLMDRIPDDEVARLVKRGVRLHDDDGVPKRGRGKKKLLEEVAPPPPAKPLQFMPKTERVAHCDAKLYKNERGEIALPVDVLRAALVAAGRDVKLDGKWCFSTLYTTSFDAFINFETDFLEPTSPLTWEVSSQKIMRGRDRKTLIASGRPSFVMRPRFEKWGFRGTIRVDFATITESQARQLFTVAGRDIGIGAMRQTVHRGELTHLNNHGVEVKKKFFGNFELAEFEVVAEPSTSSQAA